MRRTWPNQRNRRCLTRVYMEGRPARDRTSALVTLSCQGGRCWASSPVWHMWSMSRWYIVHVLSAKNAGVAHSHLCLFNLVLSLFVWTYQLNKLNKVTQDLICTCICKRKKFSPASLMNSWIIERLDRKLADVMDSNILEKCDVTLSRTIQSLTSPFLRVLFFTIYVFDFTDCPCFEVKDEEDLLSEKTVRGYKTGRGKRQSKWLWNLREQTKTPEPDNLMHLT